MKEIVISGLHIKLEHLSKSEKNMLWLGLVAEYSLFHFTMNGQRLLLLVANEGTRHSPVQLRKISIRIEHILSNPAVFFFHNLATYERDRIVAQGVYFIVGDRFAFVPNLIANRRMSKIELPAMLLPSTQHMLLYHLQCQCLDGFSLEELETVLPYKYPTLSKSVLQLSALGLSTFSTESGRTKRLQFSYDKQSLWDKSLQFMIDPVKTAVYSAKILSTGIIGSHSALSHYTMLSSEDVPTRVFTQSEFKELNLSTSVYEDVQRIEVWKYPPIAINGVVDRLSLLLSLRNDNDPRVEKELETLITQVQW